MRASLTTILFIFSLISFELFAQGLPMGEPVVPLQPLAGLDYLRHRYPVGSYYSVSPWADYVGGIPISGGGKLSMFDTFRIIDQYEKNNQYFHKMEFINQSGISPYAYSTFEMPHKTFQEFMDSKSLNYVGRDWTGHATRTFKTTTYENEEVVFKAGDKLEFAPSKDNTPQKIAVKNVTSNKEFNWNYSKYLEEKNSNNLTISKRELEDIVKEIDAAELREDSIDDITKQEEFLSEESEACSKYGDKKQILKNAIMVIKKTNNKSVELPKETGIRFVMSKDKKKNRCYLQVFRLPQKSTINLDDLKGEIYTYSVNMRDENFTPYIYIPEDYTGSVFRIKEPNKLKVIDINKNPPQFTTLPKGSYYYVKDQPIDSRLIIAHDIYEDEYQIDKNDLRNGALRQDVDFDIEMTIARQLETAQRIVTKPPLQVQCEDIIKKEKYKDYKWAIIWPEDNQCKSKKIKVGGKTQDINEFLKTWSKLTGEQVEEKLKDPDFYKMSYCIQQSLKTEGVDVTIPRCNKDKKGNYIPDYFKEGNRRRRRVPNINVCTTPEVVGTLTDQYMKAMKCAKIEDPHEMFPIIHHESRFQPGAVAYTSEGIGGIGPAQITSTLHKDLVTNLALTKRQLDRFYSGKAKDYQVNEIEFGRKTDTLDGYHNREVGKGPRVSRLYSFLLSHFEDRYDDIYKGKDPKDCKVLNELLTSPNPTEYRAMNSRICGEQNPEKSFLIAAINYQYSKRHANYMINQYEKNNNVQISEPKKTKMIKILARWMYNAGVDGIGINFEDFVTDLHVGMVYAREKYTDDYQIMKNGRIKKVKERSLDELSIEDFKKYMAVHIYKYYRVRKAKTNWRTGKSNIRPTARRKEVAKYVPGQNGIDHDLEKIQGKDGVLQCGEHL